jgi:hypothetical protein
MSREPYVARGEPPIGGLAAEDLDPTETILRLVSGEAP